MYFCAGVCLRCFSCNSKTDKQCADPFSKNYTDVGTDIVNCSDELSVQEFIIYFSNLMSLLGVPLSLDQKHTSKVKSTNRPSACQKVEINGEHFVSHLCHPFFCSHAALCKHMRILIDQKVTLIIYQVSYLII